MDMVDGSIHDFFSSNNIVDSLYVILSIGMCTITCVSRKNLIYGVGFW